jgi:hypothetical protein
MLDSDPNPYVDDPAMDNNDGDDEDARRHQDSIWARLASVSLVFEPKLFAAAIFDQATTSHLSTALGSTTTNYMLCEVFKSKALCAQADAGAISAGKSIGLTAEHLSKIWCIPFNDAARTLKNTSQLIQHNSDALLSCVASNNYRQVWYRKIKSTFYTDTMFATKKAKSLRGNTCLQLFVLDKDYIVVYPMTKESEYPLALKLFAKEIGAPDVLICDGSKTQNQREVKLFCTQIGTTLLKLEAETQFANRAKVLIGIIKESTQRDLISSGSPIVLRDYCIERRALIYQVTSKKLFQLQGSNPHAATFGTKADISNLCHFGWYKWVYYRDNSQQFPFQKKCLGRCLGPAKNEGNVMANWILT